MTRDTLSKVLAACRNMPSGVPLTDEGEVLYDIGLSDMSDADVLYGLGQCLRRCTFRPMPADIRSAAMARYAPRIDADALYGTIRGLLLRYGRHGREIDGIFYAGDPPYPSEEVREAVMNLGGWLSLCEWDSGAAALRNAVAACAEGMTRRAADTAEARMLTGGYDSPSIGPRRGDLRRLEG